MMAVQTFRQGWISFPHGSPCGSAPESWRAPAPEVAHHHDPLFPGSVLWAERGMQSGGYHRLGRVAHLCPATQVDVIRSRSTMFRVRLGHLQDQLGEWRSGKPVRHLTLQHTSMRGDRSVPFTVSAFASDDQNQAISRRVCARNEASELSLRTRCRHSMQIDPRLRGKFSTLQPVMNLPVHPQRRGFQIS